MLGHSTGLRAYPREDRFSEAVVAFCDARPPDLSTSLGSWCSEWPSVEAVRLTGADLLQGEPKQASCDESLVLLPLVPGGHTRAAGRRRSLVRAMREF